MEVIEFDHIRGALAKSGAPSSDFDLNADAVLPVNRVLREAAVLIAIQRSPAGLRVFLTMRSSALQHHPGQVAFPGGKRDDGDRELVDTALREAEEEIGLSARLVEVLGGLPSHETVTGFRVTPFVAEVDGSFAPAAEIGEVAEVFTVPLDHLMAPHNFAIEGRRWRGRIRRYYTVPYGPYYIWGATARILRALADRVGP